MTNLLHLFIDVLVSSDSFSSPLNTLRPSHAWVLDAVTASLENSALMVQALVRKALFRLSVDLRPV